MLALYQITAPFSSNLQINTNFVASDFIPYSLWMNLQVHGSLSASNSDWTAVLHASESSWEIPSWTEEEYLFPPSCSTKNDFANTNDIGV